MQILGVAWLASLAFIVVDYILGTQVWVAGFQTTTILGMKFWYTPGLVAFSSIIAGSVFYDWFRPVLEDESSQPSQHVDEWEEENL